MSASTTLGISLPKMTFALVFEDDICVDAPPIARWCIGKDAGYLYRYWLHRDAQVHWLQECCGHCVPEPGGQCDNCPVH